MKPCFIIDIDGTCSDATHRLHHIQKQPKDWNAFFDACRDDAPVLHMKEVVRALAHWHGVVFVSGRVERTREETLAWLVWHGFIPSVSSAKLYMRPDGDHRDDDVLKLELLGKLRADGFEPIMAFDDRNRVVKAWRSVGIPCAQVAEGDF